MEQFTFTYTLGEHGWADADVFAVDNLRMGSISYLSDALGDLARAAIALFTAHPTDRVAVSWQQEPGEYRWIMHREGDNVHLVIRHFDDCFNRQEDQEGILRFETTCPWTRLATQVKGQLQQILNEFGEDGYKKRWMEHAFPIEQLKRLEELILAEKQRKRHPETPADSDGL